MSLKTCNVCNIEKDISFFRKRKDKVRNPCKECFNKQLKLNKKVYDIPTEGTFSCCNCGKEKMVEEFSVDATSPRGLRYRCKQCENEKRTENNRADLEKSRQKYRDQSRKRRKDVKNRIRLNLGTRLYLAVQKKHGNTMDLTGCSKDELISHLESKFTEGMTLENYGEWHIDHIKPCASFDLSNLEEQKKCFHWSNLQPLWASENIRKGCKV
jgi:hypothetical protein